MERGVEGEREREKVRKSEWKFNSRSLSDIRTFIYIRVSLQFAPFPGFLSPQAARVAAVITMILILIIRNNSAGHNLHIFAAFALVVRFWCNIFGIFTCWSAHCTAHWLLSIHIARIRIHIHKTHSMTLWQCDMGINEFNMCTSSCRCCCYLMLIFSMPFAFCNLSISLFRIESQLSDWIINWNKCIRVSWVWSMVYAICDENVNVRILVGSSVGCRNWKICKIYFNCKDWKATTIANISSTSSSSIYQYTKYVHSTVETIGIWHWEAFTTFSIYFIATVLSLIAHPKSCLTIPTVNPFYCSFKIPCQTRYSYGTRT